MTVTLTKRAVLGGGQDVPFEQAFSNLAHAYLKDKAPGLMDYEIGFQLIDRNQENTKAVGVFGFKVGKQWLFAPVFFINGDLKGHELLYLKDQDSFVPLKENWVNYILNKRPIDMGEGVDKNLSQLGVLPPHLYQISRSPNKFASTDQSVNRMAEWIQPVLSQLASCIVDNPFNDDKYKGLQDLPMFVKNSGKNTLIDLLITLEEYPKLAEYVESYYGLDFIDDLVKQTKEADSVLVGGGNNKRKPHTYFKKVDNKKSILPAPDEINKLAEVKQAVKVMRESGFNITGISPKEREVLVRERMVIKDQRTDEDVSVAFNVMSTITLFNPDVSGLYDVLVKPGEFERCLVIVGPYSRRGRKNWSTIIKLEGEKTYLNAHQTVVLCQNHIIDKQWKKWFDGLEDATSFKKGGKYVLIGERDGSVPFYVEEELSNEEGIKTYKVHWYDHADISRPSNLPEIDKEWATPLEHHYDQGHECDITITGKDGKLAARGGTLYVPNDYKKITIKLPPKEKDDDDDTPSPGCECCSNEAYSRPEPINLGNLADAQLMLFGKLASVTVRNTGSEININNHRFLDPLDAVSHLVVQHGLREKQARVMIDESRKKKVANYYIKYSAPYNLLNQGPSAPPFPDAQYGYDPMTGNNVPTQYETEHNLVVPDLQAALTDRSIYHPLGPETQPFGKPKPDQAAQQAALQAGQTGQKEIFDTAMLGSLLRTTRDDSMIDKNMGDIMKGMDRIGRILFMFYWHGDQFEERYGKGDLPELEDSLRNAFESVGDIWLFLKQKSVHPHPEEFGSSSVDLSAVANS